MPACFFAAMKKGLGTRWGGACALLWAAGWIYSPAAPASLARAADAARPPNVVLILADDLGASDLGCCGSKFHRTPHLDKLAADGVRFAQAYAACPVCSPTRAALMTGKYPARLQITDWLPGRPDNPAQKLRRPMLRQHLPLAEVTLAEALKSAGYATASIGKWHLGGEGFGPTQQGFDLNVAGDSAGSPMSYFAPYQRNGRFIPGLEQAPEEEYLTDRLTAEAVSFIKSHREEPFFLYVPHYAVHIPMKAKTSVQEKYPKATPFRGTQSNPIYAAMLESLDEGVGEIVKTLAELKLDRNTIVVFTSDNGGLCVTEGPNTPATSNAPFREGKGFLYDGGIRVPLIVKWPGGGRSGAVSQTPVSSIDLFPTILELCGVKAETASAGKDSTVLSKSDGVSLVAELAGTGTVERDALYWHYPHYANQGGRPGGAIREGEYKLIEFYENGRRELFHVAKDVGESQNVSDKHPDIVERLALKLAAWRESVGALMPTPNPDYRPNPPDKDGNILIHSRTAEVHGVMLRFEPMPHKNTLGYWVRQDDWARFEFTADKSGTYDLEALVGCGNGSGGAEVDFVVAPAAMTLKTNDGANDAAPRTLTLKVDETGGFQNFVARKLGDVRLEEAGRYEITVRAKKKPGVAVMDLREMTLKPVR